MRRLLGLLAVALVFLLGTGNLDEAVSALEKSGVRYAKQHGTGLVAVTALLVAWVLGFLVGRYRNRYRMHDFQNRGEARLSRTLAVRFVPPDYHLLNHVTLRVKDGTTQIDHILVSRFGIYVIETKDHQGWIFGAADDRFWTKVHYRLNFRFQNPIRQNYKHVCAVRELLDFLPADSIRSAVVFVGDAKFKTAIPDGVFTMRGLVTHIEADTTEIMSLNRLQFCVGRLETARLSMSKAIDVEHVMALRRRFGNDD
jgi:hypothetical protein